MPKYLNTKGKSQEGIERVDVAMPGRKVNKTFTRHFTNNLLRVNCILFLLITKAKFRLY